MGQNLEKINNENLRMKTLEIKNYQRITKQTNNSNKYASNCLSGRSVICHGSRRLCRRIVTNEATQVHRVEGRAGTRSRSPRVTGRTPRVVKQISRISNGFHAAPNRSLASPTGSTRHQSNSTCHQRIPRVTKRSLASPTGSTRHQTDLSRLQLNVCRLDFDYQGSRFRF